MSAYLFTVLCLAGVALCILLLAWFARNLGANSSQNIIQEA